MPESMNFSFTQLNVALLIPMCISLVGGIVLLGVGIFNKAKSRKLYIAISMLFVILNLGFLFLEGSPQPQLGFFNLLLVDGVSILVQILILLSSFIILLFLMHKNTRTETQGAEFYALLLFAIAGFGFMVSSENLILILLGLECASLSIYTMIALHNKTSAFEAAIKYFVLGALATALFAFGALLLYAATGSLEISRISVFLQEHTYEPHTLVYAGFVFLLVALGFKISIVPFHTWGPDVYEGSNALLTVFIAIVPKIATLGVLIRIFGIFIHAHNPFVEYTLYVMIALTMTIPNLIALVQKDVKRMLAYSSISHSGFVLSAILIDAPGIVFLYWFFFVFANLGVFGILWLYIDSRNNDTSHSFESLSGLIKTNPTLGALLSLLMFALGGIPPFCVFWGKMYLMQAVLNTDYIILALLMAFNSTLAAFYYLKVVVYVLAKEPKDAVPYRVEMETSSIFALTITAIISLCCIFMVQNLLEVVATYIGNSGF